VRASVDKISTGSERDARSSRGPSARYTSFFLSLGACAVFPRTSLSPAVVDKCYSNCLNVVVVDSLWSRHALEFNDGPWIRATLPCVMRQSSYLSYPVPRPLFLSTTAVYVAYAFFRQVKAFTFPCKLVRSVLFIVELKEQRAVGSLARPVKQSHVYGPLSAMLLDQHAACCFCSYFPPFFLPSSFFLIFLPLLQFTFPLSLPFSVLRSTTSRLWLNRLL